MEQKVHIPLKDFRQMLDSISAYFRSPDNDAAKCMAVMAMATLKAYDPAVLAETKDEGKEN